MFLGYQKRFWGWLTVLSGLSGLVYLLLEPPLFIQVPCSVTAGFLFAEFWKRRYK